MTTFDIVSLEEVMYMSAQIFSQRTRRHCKLIQFMSTYSVNGFTL